MHVTEKKKSHVLIFKRSYHNMLYLPEFLLIFSFKSLWEIISGADGAYSDFPVKKQMYLFLLLLSSNFVLLLINNTAIPAIHVHVHL